MITIYNLPPTFYSTICNIFRNIAFITFLQYYFYFVETQQVSASYLAWFFPHLKLSGFGYHQQWYREYNDLEGGVYVLLQMF
jgi:hypothetical protein